METAKRGVTGQEVTGEASSNLDAETPVATRDYQHLWEPRKKARGKSCPK